VTANFFRPREFQPQCLHRWSSRWHDVRFIPKADKQRMISVSPIRAKWRHFALRKKIESFRRRSTVKDVADLPIGA
jgi:hypothetical protein